MRPARLLIVNEIRYLLVTRSGTMLFFQFVNRRYEHAARGGVTKADEDHSPSHQAGQSPSSVCRKGQEIPDKGSGWWHGESASMAHGPANDLFGVFDTLWLKSGFVLHACVHQEFLGGNGRIWAVPTDSLPVASGGHPNLEREWMKRPPGAVPLMEAIEGDGSPWSYLSASILSREAAEFGAYWHGLDWSVHTILSEPPRQADDPDVSGSERPETGDAPVGNWTWHAPVPDRWAPTFVETGTATEVVLHAYNPIAGGNVYRVTDRYPTGSYVGKTATRGFVF